MPATNLLYGTLDLLILKVARIPARISPMLPQASANPATPPIRASSTLSVMSNSKALSGALDPKTT